MALYKIENDNCLGVSHSGPVNIKSEGFVELSDEEVEKIVNLIRKERTSDIAKLMLEDVYPDIYDKLCAAYYEMAYNAEELYWLRTGWNNGYFDYDIRELIIYCMENCGYDYEFDEGESIDDLIDEDGINCNILIDFTHWLDYYIESLDDEEFKDFLYNHINVELDLDDIEYEVYIPKAIIKLAEKKN